MLLSQQLVQGVDLWINTPRRPWEASGTSGMKVLANGGMNLSELDGWWAEAYTPEVGWAIGDGKEHGDDPNVDAAEAEELYILLEREIIPKFYQRDEQGYSHAVDRDDAREHGAAHARSSGEPRGSRIHRKALSARGRGVLRARPPRMPRRRRNLLEWQRALARTGRTFDSANRTLRPTKREHVFEVPVYLDEVSADAVSVELYADPTDGDQPMRQPMQRGHELLGSVGGYTYSGIGSCHAAAERLSRPRGSLSSPARCAAGGKRNPMAAMKYDFLIDTYATERVKVISAWSMFRDEELPVRPNSSDPRGRSVHEQMVHQCVSEDFWFEKSWASMSARLRCPSARSAGNSWRDTPRTAANGWRCCRPRRALVGRNRIASSMSRGREPG